MITFKNILQEAVSSDVPNEDGLEKAVELDEYLRKGVFKNQFSFLIWRGMRGVNVDTWKWFQMQKYPKRHNVWFPAHIKELIFQLEEAYPKDVPHQRHSAWASSLKREARDYGPEPYVCFINKDAKIVTWERSTATYFYGISTNLSEYGMISEKMKQEDPKFYKFMKNLKSIKVREGSFPNAETVYYLERAEFAAKFILDNLDYIKKMVRKYGKSRYIKDFEKIHKYFEDMKREITEDSKHILFSGDPYILVNEDFFRKYFNWNGNEWRLKDDYL